MPIRVKEIFDIENLYINITPESLLAIIIRVMEFISFFCSYPLNIIMCITIILS